MTHQEYMAIAKFKEGLLDCLKDDRRACEVIDLHFALVVLGFEQEANNMEKYYATH